MRVTIKQLQKTIETMQEQKDAYLARAYKAERDLEEKNRYKDYEMASQQRIGEAEWRAKYEGFKEATELFLRSPEAEKFDIEQRQIHYGKR